MTRPISRTVALALIVPLALGLAACGKEKSGAATSGEPIAKIAAPAGKPWADTVTKTPEGGYLTGNPNAPIKLVEYGALSCSHCAEFADKSAAELRDNFIASGRVSYELRLYMLNALDVPAALLVTCGAPESVPTLAHQFWGWQPEMFNKLQASGDAMQALSNQPPAAQFAGIAKITGMDEFIKARGIAADQANACLADTARGTAFADATQKANTEFEITGTPTFLINGKKFDGNSTWEEVKARLQQLGAR